MSDDKNRLGLTKINYLLLVLAAILLIVGYIIMSYNEISISPLILAAVYAALIPLALLYKPKKK
ncbi:MAG: hypothetical protein GX294_07465 [Candidatus Cloacimonetes bacterium]|nr:hypothetical protein [Candidatus Cloacimonadota bacterium]